MKWNSSDTEGARIAAPSGDIDHSSAEAFKAALLPVLDDPPKGRLILDLSRVGYMSSVGLRVIMLAVKHTKANGTVFAVAGLNDTLTEIFQITRFDKILDIYPDLDAALAS